MKKLTTQARELRNNQTAAERYLWQHLRKRQISNFKFRRQHVFKNFIVDFVCLEAKLIIEIDGSTHKNQVEYDAMRTEFLVSLGYCVLRFTNYEVFNYIQKVLKDIVVLLPVAPK